MATPRVFCEMNNEKWSDIFYLLMSNKEEPIWLFTQEHRNGVYNYFRTPRTISEASNYTKSINNGGLRRTMDKLPKYIKYVEKEYEINVFGKNKRRKQ